VIFGGQVILKAQFYPNFYFSWKISLKLSQRKPSAAIKSLIGLQPKVATIIKDGRELEVPIFRGYGRRYYFW